MSMDLIVLISLGVTAGVIFVGLPLMKRPGASAIRADYDMRVYKDQLGEVDRDLARGLLTPSQAESARLELQRRLLAADAESQQAHGKNKGAKGAKTAGGEAIAQDTPGRQKTRVALAALLIFLIPVGALVLYGALGQPNMPDQPFTFAQSQRLNIPESQLTDLMAQADALHEKAVAADTDQKLWLELAQARAAIRQSTQALIAYDRALALGGVDSQTWSSIGETHALAANGEVNAQARAAFVNALKADRHNPQARYYIGMAFAQQGDAKSALAVWRDLSQSSPADAPWMPMLRNRMARVAQQAGIPPVAVSPAHALDVVAGTAEITIAEPGAQLEPEAADGAIPGLDTEQMTMVRSMVQRLKDRLAESPDDYEGWMRLGQSLRVLGDPQGSADAYGKAAALTDGDEAVKALFAQALALIELADSNDQIDPGPDFAKAVERVLELAPDSPDALYLGGLRASIVGDIETARSMWSKLLASIPEDSDAHKALKRQMDSLGASQ